MKSISNFSTVNSNQFYVYLAKVISCFEGNNYQYRSFDVINDNNFEIFRVKVIFEVTGYVMKRLNDIKMLSEVRDLINQCKTSFIVMELENRECPNDKIMLLDTNMKIGFTNGFIERFPFVQVVVYDFVNHIYERSFQQNDVDYNYLFRTIEKRYKNEVLEYRNEKKLKKEIN